MIVEVAGWLAGAILLWRLPTLSQQRGSARVSVIVPARDEAARLPPLLASLRAQTLPPFEVIVVDDGSTDATAAVAVAAGALVVQTEGPPAGWRGKPWACELGVRRATGSVLVLLDADVRLAPDALARLVGEHERDPGALLSVQPRHVTGRAHEQLSAVCNVVSVMGARHAKVAFGPCLVTTPSSLTDVGGFGSVRDEIVEDIALARRYERSHWLVGDDVVTFRMYEEGLGQLVNGWTKNLASGAGKASPLSSLGAVLWVTGALLAVTTPVAYVAFALQLGWFLRRLGRFRWWAWVAYPLPLAAFVLLFLASVVGRRRARWRGRPC